MEETSPPPGTHRNWRKYADGKWYVAEQGKDFGGEPALFRDSARQWASRNGYRCSARCYSSSVKFRIYKEEES